MNRNEFLEALPLSRVTLKMTGATLEILTDEIEDIHVMVSGADGDVKSLRISVSGDQLLVEQPAMSLTKKPISTSWLQVTIRLPRSWKGRIEGRTVSGWINARGLAGSDLSLESVSGLISLAGAEFISVGLRSVTGDLRLSGLVCEKCSFGSTSGEITVQDSRVTNCSLSTVTGSASLQLLSAFEAITATSVTGDLFVEAPIAHCNAVLRSVSGRIRSSGVSILEEAQPSVRFSAVTGCLDLAHTDYPIL